MSRTISVLVRVDRTANTVTLAVTGTPTSDDRQTMDLSSTRALHPRDPQDPQEEQEEHTNHRDDGQPEISSAPTAAHPVTAPPKP